MVKCVVLIYGVLRTNTVFGIHYRPDYLGLCLGSSLTNGDFPTLGEFSEPFRFRFCMNVELIGLGTESWHIGSTRLNTRYLPIKEHPASAPLNVHAKPKPKRL
jgi:hypothetical protein